MTSRYCILGSFLGKSTNETVCKRPCKNSYYLKDLHDAKYYLICDNIDCIMRILKYRKKQEIEKSGINIRNAII